MNSLLSNYKNELFLECSARALLTIAWSRFINRIVCIVLLLYANQLYATDSNGYVGASQCQDCHLEEYQKWRQSDHFHAMAIADHESILATFNGEVVDFHGVTYRFFEQDEQYFVEMGNAKDKLDLYQIKYTFGHRPLQQYLIELDKGFTQALNVAWDSRSAEEGGGRWFHLQPNEDITPTHPFYWKNHFQNWNARCADCHSTNLSKNYDEENHQYSTKFSQINVGCEACHGPGEKHVEFAQKPDYSSSNTGLSLVKGKKLDFAFKENNPIAMAKGIPTDDQVNMCGACHSLRTPLSDNRIQSDYHQDNRIQLLNDLSYFVDGQIREETYVLGSFLQSKMYQKGVTCTNCHDPHRGNLIAKGNSLCAQCHRSEVYDAKSHHHHERNSSGAECVNCHMPETTYMQVDDRRDHSFSIPRPDLSISLGVPNACITCHQDKENVWALDNLKQWDGLTSSDNMAKVSHEVQSGNRTITRELIDIIESEDLTDFKRASLLANSASIISRDTAQTAIKHLQQDNSLLRRASVTALRYLPSQTRWQILEPYFDDPSRVVRFEVAESLFPSYTELNLTQQQKLDTLLVEYRQILSISSDSPATQLNFANLELAMQNYDAAEQAYLKALTIEPAYVPALLNLADFYRASGDTQRVEPLLIKAIKIAPESAAANHSYGLHLIRAKKYDQAITYLAQATKTIDAEPRYAYVYAVALENSGNVTEAIKVLESASVRWPYQVDLLLTLVRFMDKSGQNGTINHYLSLLKHIVPDSPEVIHLIKKYAD